VAPIRFWHALPSPDSPDQLFRRREKKTGAKMARSVWTGFLSFGLVNVPVGLFAATRDQSLHFNQLHKGTSHRIRYKKVDEVTGEEVSNDDIVSGYEIGKDEYVILDKEELKEVAPGRSELIEITDFVDLEEIDPVYFKQTYYLAPRGKGSDHAYALLRQAMGDTSKVAIATFVMRDKEHLVAVRPGDDVLIVETMYFSDEIRDAKSELDSLPQNGEVKGRELDIAKQLVNSLSTDWQPEKYKDTYRERVEALIDEKRKGHEVVIHHETAPKSNVVDLMAALEASVAKAKESGVVAEATKKEAAAPRAQKASNVQQQQFEGMTKAELLERAAEVELQGRSKMSKDELVDALTDLASSKRRRRAS
jgi:DNA end-binding protein Ku